VPNYQKHTPSDCFLAILPTGKVENQKQRSEHQANAKVIC